MAKSNAHEWKPAQGFQGEECYICIGNLQWHLCVTARGWSVTNGRHYRSGKARTLDHAKELVHDAYVSLKQTWRRGHVN